MLPLIMDFLSREGPVTLQRLFDGIKNAIVQDQPYSYNAFRNSVNQAISLGTQMGIVKVTNDTIKITFDFHYNKIKDEEAHQLNLQKSSIGMKRKQGGGKTRRPVKRVSSHRQISKVKKAQSTTKVKNKSGNE